MNTRLKPFGDRILERMSNIFLFVDIFFLITLVAGTGRVEEMTWGSNEEKAAIAYKKPAYNGLSSFWTY